MSVTTIEWTKRPGTIGETWNPTSGCNKVDRGCKNCYAEIMHRRLQAMGLPKYANDFLDGAFAHEDTLTIPLAWKKPRTVFVDSMSDLFHKNISFEFIRRVFEVMRDTPQHTYLILTKRPERAVEFFNWNWPRTPQEWNCPSNIWMGTSVNDQESAEIRIHKLLLLDCKVLFLSYEPATGPLNLRSIKLGNYHINAFEGFRKSILGGILPEFDHHDPGVSNKLSWVIAGGESGPKAVASNPAWFRTVRDDCKAAGVPYFFKQYGLWHPYTGPKETGKIYHVTRYTDDREPMYKANDKSFNLLDGEVWQQFPQLKTTA